MNVGDKVAFTCNGRRRAGHYHVSGFITKVNRKTYDITEAPGSRVPGTRWRINKEQVTLYK